MHQMIKTRRRWVPALSTLLMTSLWGSAAALPDEHWERLCTKAWIGAEELGKLGYQRFQELQAKCIRDGEQTRIGPYEIDDDIIPVDVDSVSLFVDDSASRFDLGKLPSVTVHPITRDLFCDRHRDDWLRLKIRCPLPRMFSLQDANVFRLMIGDDSSLGNAGIPYKLAFSGNAQGLEFSHGKTIFSRSLSFDKVVSQQISLTNLVVIGDLTISKSKIEFLDLSNSIIVGSLILSDSDIGMVSTVDALISNSSGTVVHSNVLVRNFRVGCEPGAVRTIDALQRAGPLFLDKCIEQGAE